MVIVAHEVYVVQIERQSLQIVGNIDGVLPGAQSCGQQEVVLAEGRFQLLDQHQEVLLVLGRASAFPREFPVQIQTVEVVLPETPRTICVSIVQSVKDRT